MSVARGRPPGLAGGIRGTRRAYRSSLGDRPAAKSPTKVRLCAVHTACLREGLSPSGTADLARVCPHSPEPHQLLERLTGRGGTGSHGSPSRPPNRYPTGKVDRKLRERCYRKHLPGSPRYGHNTSLPPKALSA